VPTAVGLGLPADGILLVVGIAVGRILILRIVRKATVMTVRPAPAAFFHFG
jgi:hypothetical protein